MRRRAADAKCSAEARSEAAAAAQVVRRKAALPLIEQHNAELKKARDAQMVREGAGDEAGLSRGCLIPPFMSPPPLYIAHPDPSAAAAVSSQAGGCRQVRGTQGGAEAGPGGRGTAGEAGPWGEEG